MRILAAWRSASRRSMLIAAACLASALTAGFLSAQQEPQESPNPLYRVESQLVQLFLTVTDGGKMVTGLPKETFTVTEDGSPREISHVDSTDVPLYLALLLDTSESMREALGVVQDAAISFAGALHPEDRVVLVQFNSDIRSVPQLTDDRTPIVEAIRNTRASGGTKLYDALLWAMKHLNGKPGRKAIVLFSDGEDTVNTSSLGVVLNAAARYGFPIFTIGAGAGLERDGLKQVLRKVAEVNSGRAYVVDETRKLGEAFAEVLGELRSAFVLNYYTQVPPDGRWHDVKISAAETRYRIHARSGFYARAREPRDLFARSGGNAEGRRRFSLAEQDADLNDPAAIRASEELRAAASAVPATMKERPVAPPVFDSADGDSGTPVFRVETRFVEVPVLVERSGRDTRPLVEKNFRIYESDALREVAFFSRSDGALTIAQLQDQAMHKVGASSRAIRLSADPEQLKFGRVFLVLDDLMMDSRDFMRARAAVEKILKEQSSPLRPLSLHFTSRSQADINRIPPVESLLAELRKSASRSSPTINSNDGVMNIHEAYLVDRGDASARMLAELRYASTIGAFYQNELGTVQGDSGVPAETVRTGVQSAARNLVVENFSQAIRVVDSIRAVVGAAAADGGDHPRTIVFISGGFCLGRHNLHGEVAGALDSVIQEARRAKVRFYSVDAVGLTNDEPLGMMASAGFLVANPHLQGLLQQHSSGWRLEKQAPLHQLATDTGGRLLHSTNDLAAAATRGIAAAGELYYLGFLSTQAADGRYRSIRVTVSEPGARVYARSGYFAGQTSISTAPADTTTDWREVVARAERARKSGDFPALAENLEKLTGRFPGQVSLWFNLGATHLQLGNPKRAVDALQRAFALAPDDRDVGVALAHALVGAGYRKAAGETLERLLQRQPHDVDLLVHLGRVYEAGGQMELAFRTYRRVLDIDQQIPLDAYLLLARTAFSLGRDTEAEIFALDYLAQGGAPEKLGTPGQSLAAGTRGEIR